MDNLFCAGTERLSFRSILCQADRPCACPLLSRYPCRCWPLFPFDSLIGIAEIRFLLVTENVPIPVGVRIAAALLFSCFPHMVLSLRRNFFLFSCQDSSEAHVASASCRGEGVLVRFPVDEQRITRKRFAVIKPVVEIKSIEKRRFFLFLEKNLPQSCFSCIIKLVFWNYPPAI